MNAKIIASPYPAGPGGGTNRKRLRDAQRNRKMEGFSEQEYEVFRSYEYDLTIVLYGVGEP